MTPLQGAVEKGNIEIAKILLAQKDINVNAKSILGNFYLLYLNI